MIGLRNWDDLLVRARDGAVFAVPSVPLLPEYLEPASLPGSGEQLCVDARLVDQIRWHVTSIVFGGSGGDEQNIVWVTPLQHAQLVAWWNDRYRGASTALTSI